MTINNAVKTMNDVLTIYQNLYAYCLSNKAMPGILIVKITNEPIESIMYEAKNPDMPYDYKIEFVKKVFSMSTEEYMELFDCYNKIYMKNKGDYAYFKATTTQVKKMLFRMKVIKGNIEIPYDNK